MEIKNRSSNILGRVEIIVISVLLVVGAAICMDLAKDQQSEAALEYDNSIIADTMLAFVGQNGVEVCRKAALSLAYSGECKQTVNCALAIASGGRQYPAGGSDYNASFRAAGGVEVSPAEAVKGDIIQVQTNQVTHTAVVVSNLGSNNFSVVDSNYNYDHTIKLHNWAIPSGAKIWRMGTAKVAVAEKPKCDAVAPETTCVWRLTSKQTGYHFYTTNINERNTIMDNGSHSLEGVAFYSRTTHTPGTSAVYRLHWSNKHFWTANVNERDSLIASGAIYEGVAWYSNNATLNSGYPIYRLYNTKNGDHLLTTNKNEADLIVKNGWVLETSSIYGASPMVNDSAKVLGQREVYRVALQNEHFWTNGIVERDVALRLPGARYEGVAWTASDHVNSRPVYRLALPDGRHFWTMNVNEKNILVAKGYKYEGVAWYESDDASRNVYRLYKQTTNNHFWTANETEKNSLVNNSGYNLEGVGWRY